MESLVPSGRTDISMSVRPFGALNFQTSGTYWSSERFGLLRMPCPGERSRQHLGREPGAFDPE
jgi:hypothetical protein